MEAYLSSKNFAFVFEYQFFEEKKFHTQQNILIQYDNVIFISVYFKLLPVKH